MFSVLPPQEHTFTLDVKGSASGEQFTGSFTYVRPTIGMSIEIGKTKAFMLGGAPNVDDDTDAVADMLATLRHTLVKFPEWWKETLFGTKLYDLNVVFDIFKKCTDFEKARDEKLAEVKPEIKDEKARSA